MREHQVPRTLTRVICALFLISCSESSTSPDPNPVPSVSSTTPGSVTVGVVPVFVSVNGSGFVPESRVQINGADRATTLQNSSILSVQLQAQDVATLGAVELRVVNPPPGGGTSAALSLGVAPPPNPAPSLRSAAPRDLFLGDAPAVVTVLGGNFVPASRVRIGGVDRATTMLTDSTLSVQLLAEDMAGFARLALTVVNPMPGGGSAGPIHLGVGGRDPVVTDATPDSMLVATVPAPTLVITGSGFHPNATVMHFFVPIYGAAIISDTEIRAPVPDGLLTNGALRAFFVQNPAPGTASDYFTFTVLNRIPEITSFGPTTLYVGGAPTQITVRGRFFVGGMTALFDGISRQVQVEDPTTAHVYVWDSDLWTARTAELRLVTPTPGGGTSAPVSVQVVAPPPGLVAPSAPSPRQP